MQALEVKQIEDNILSIDVLIKQFEGLDDPNQTVDYMQKLCAIQSLATETQASAKYRLLEARDEYLEKALGTEVTGFNGKAIKIAPSIVNLRADSKCKQMHYLYERSQRLSSSLSHAIEAVRSKISYIKQEMQNAGYQ